MPRRERLRVLVLGGTWPAFERPTEAADLVTHEFLRVLSSLGSFDLVYAPVSFKTEAIPQPVASELEVLARGGVDFRPPVKLDHGLAKSRIDWLSNLVFGRPETVIPGAIRQPMLETLVAEVRPDVILTVWSEAATAAASRLDTPTVAYYGDPDPEIARANTLLDMRENNVGAVRAAKNRIVLWGTRRAHVRVMRALAAIDDVSANAVSYYRARGVRHVRYVPCLRECTPGRDWQTLRDATEQLSPLKIVGSVGSLAGTGNSYAFLTLGTEVLPALTAEFGEWPFEVHIFGGGKPRACVKSALDHPSVRVRGFVDDLDAEILSAPIFMIPHNRGPFTVAYSRVLHAWSLGACIVAFRETAIAMPEIEHGMNALLADTSAEMARYVAEAGSDVKLRRRLGAAGVETLHKRYEPQVVVAETARDLYFAGGRAMPNATAMASVQQAI